MQDNFLESDPLDLLQIPNLRQSQDLNSQCEEFYQQLGDFGTIEQKASPTIKQVLSSMRKKKSKSKNKMIRRVSKSRAQKQSSYRKNICGYITKKVIREFIQGNYKKNVKYLCEREGVGMENAIEFYESKIQAVTGPSHLPALFRSSNSQQAPINRVFLKFFKWFIKQRYFRHLISQGKMEVRKAYIDYKNNQLLQLVSGYEKQLFNQFENSSTLSASENAGISLIQ